MLDRFDKLADIKLLLQFQMQHLGLVQKLDVDVHSVVQNSGEHLVQVVEFVGIHGFGQVVLGLVDHGLAG